MTTLETLFLFPFYTLETQTTSFSSYYISIFLLNFLSYIYVFLKFYKILCYSKLTFEWLPMINPYTWPFSLFFSLTAPYFKFWALILPSIKFEKSSVEISAIVGLEALNAGIYFCVRAANFFITFLQEAEKGSIQNLF